ncbi:hypothetical protein AHF37_08728, partial [Paragonimus kellicotti]
GCINSPIDLLHAHPQDSFVSLGWLSPGQRILLEEYCQRYGIRECQRHLAFLKNLLDKAEHGVRTDPDLIHISYSLCANHVSGKTHHDQAVHTVLAVEREQFQVIKRRLTMLLERQITEFRYCFPFGRPEGALEKTISLLERVRQCSVVFLHLFRHSHCTNGNTKLCDQHQ